MFVAREMLSEEESRRFAEIIEFVKPKIKGAVEVWAYVIEIRDRKLYRAKYDTFADCVEQELGIGRAHAYRMIQASEVAADLSPTGRQMPSNERQARPLAALPSDARAEAWKKAQEKSGSDQPPAKVVQAVVDEKLGKPKPPPRPKAKPKPAEKPEPEFEEVTTAGKTEDDIADEAEAEKERAAIRDEARTQDQIDDEYIAGLPLHSILKDQQLKHFIADVRFYLFTLQAFKAARSKSSEAVNKFRHIGRFGHRARSFFKIDGPEKWLPCPAPEDGGCGGTGYQGQGSAKYPCASCRCDGYRINTFSN